MLSAVILANIVKLNDSK